MLVSGQSVVSVSVEQRTAVPLNMPQPPPPTPSGSKHEMSTAQRQSMRRFLCPEGLRSMSAQHQTTRRSLSHRGPGRKSLQTPPLPRPLLLSLLTKCTQTRFALRPHSPLPLSPPAPLGGVGGESGGAMLPGL